MVYYKFQNNEIEDLKVGKIICLARTYKKHAKEMRSEVPKEPLLFLKPSSSVIFNNESIIIPSITKDVHHEVELGVIIGSRCSKIKKKDALENVLGYLVALDITARDIQSIAKKNGWPWSIAKGFDTFCPISDAVLKERIVNVNNLDLSLKVNGEIRQKSNTNNMVFTVEEIIEYISNIMTLEPGDLILTGTPEGVNQIKKEDILESKLDEICSLRVNVK